MVSIIILWERRRICGPSLTETSLCCAYLYTHKQKESCIDLTCSGALPAETRCVPLVECLLVAWKLLQVEPSNRYVWGFRSSGIWDYVAGAEIHDVSKDHISFIFKAQGVFADSLPKINRKKYVHCHFWNTVCIIDICRSWWTRGLRRGYAATGGTEGCLL
jgi:hypothetical protein